MLIMGKSGKGDTETLYYLFSSFANLKLFLYKNIGGSGVGENTVQFRLSHLPPRYINIIVIHFILGGII